MILIAFSEIRRIFPQIFQDLRSFSQISEIIQQIFCHFVKVQELITKMAKISKNL